MKLGKRGIAAAVCLAAAALAVGAVLLLLPRTPEKKFPLWEESLGQKVDSRVSFSFVGIHTGVDYGDTVMDEVEVSLHKGLDGPETMGGSYLVEYQYEGNWYTVYRPEGETEESYLGEEREVNLVKAVPAGLFQITGTYRIYLTDLGYCEFTIEQPLGSAVSQPPQEESLDQSEETSETW